MKVLVTGASGFIGHHLIRHLLARGDRVRAAAGPDTPPDRRSRLEGLDVRAGDIREPGFCREACEDMDAVVHCAAVVGITDREQTIRSVNVDGTLRIVEAAAAAGASRVIHLSTATVVGSVEGPPVDSTAPLRPGNAYARSKADSEVRALAAAADLDLDLAVVRPPWVYGPGDLRTLGLYRMLQRRLPLPWRTDTRIQPVHVDDFCAGTLGCLDAFPTPGGHTYYLAGRAPVPMRDYIPRLAAALGVRPPRHLSLRAAMLAARAADRVGGRLDVTLPITRRRLAFFTHHNAYSIGEATRDFGYDPIIGPDEGLPSTVAWYRRENLL